MSNPPADQAAAASPPRIPTGQEIFDIIMSHIEPELTSEGLKAIDAKYASETPEDKQARRKRYEQAFVRYEQAYQGYMATLNEQVQRFYRQSFTHIEQEDRQREGGDLSAIEAQLFQAA
jgi:hypothetical protein